MCWLSPTDTAKKVVSYSVDVCVGGFSDQCDSMPSLRIMCCSDVFIFVYKGMFEGKHLKEKKYTLIFVATVFARMQGSDKLIAFIAVYCDGFPCKYLNSFFALSTCVRETERKRETVRVMEYMSV